VRRRAFLLDAATLAATLGPWPAHAQPPASAQKVFRYAFNTAETGFDPAQVNDLYSRTINRNIFDAPLTYDYLARPAKLIPNVAVTMPEIADDYRTFTVRLKPGMTRRTPSTVRQLRNRIRMRIRKSPGRRRRRTGAD